MPKLPKPEYYVGDKVMIKELKRPATVTALYIDREGLQYRCSFWDNASKKTEYLNSDEIESGVSDEKRAGFVFKTGDDNGARP